MIDLHLHSTFSDGSLTPEQLVEKGREVSLTAMALTDHDCTSGVPRFLAACERVGLHGISGVEISADIQKGTLHMLGYYVDGGNEGLKSMLCQLRAGREERNREILKKLNELGLALSWEEVVAYAAEDVVGRPHFARAMLAKGYVASRKDAFARFLGKGRPAYVDRFRLSAADSIRAIAGAGGLAVLSHPLTLGLSRQALRDFVRELVGMGLDGIEVYYSEHSPEQTQEYRQLVEQFKLVATGGSDFHGDLNPSVGIGYGFGSLRVPDETPGLLRARRAAKVL